MVASIFAFVTELLNNVELLLEEDLAFRAIALPFGSHLLLGNNIVVNYVLGDAISQLRADARQRPALKNLRVLQLLELLFFFQAGFVLLNLLDSILNILQRTEHLLPVLEVLVDSLAREAHI